ncbi:MAG: hypothetical protein ACYCW6_15865 [Candidatus Xenobia bacterium]
MRKHQISLQGGHTETDGNGKNGTTIHTVTDTQVSGQVTFYRPIPK